MSLDTANKYIESFVKVIGTVPDDFNKEGLKTGVDLGTANICIAVLDKYNNPVTGEIYQASVVKDGLVVDYLGAVAIVKVLKEKIEKRLGVTLHDASVAVPPGTVGKNASAFVNVVEASGMNVINTVDEPTAASFVLDIENGAVVDVGGGTTGISIIKDGKVIASHDEPTGGGHMTLVLAGNYNISIDEAEKIKLDVNNHRDIFHIIRPVIEKMAAIVNGFIKDYDIETIYIVGGASCFDGFEEIFYKECGIKSLKPVDCLFVTPLGIALHETI